MQRGHDQPAINVGTINMPMKNEGTGSLPATGGDFPGAKTGRGADKPKDVSVAPGVTPDSTMVTDNSRFPKVRGRGADQPK